MDELTSYKIKSNKPRADYYFVLLACIRRAKSCSFGSFILKRLIKQRLWRFLEAVNYFREETKKGLLRHRFIYS